MILPLKSSELTHGKGLRRFIHAFSSSCEKSSEKELQRTRLDSDPQEGIALRILSRPKSRNTLALQPMNNLLVTFGLEKTKSLLLPLSYKFSNNPRRVLPSPPLFLHIPRINNHASLIDLLHGLTNLPPISLQRTRRTPNHADFSAHKWDILNYAQTRTDA
jgi:hypothetical protein